MEQIDDVWGPHKVDFMQRRCIFGDRYKLKIHDTYRIVQNLTSGEYLEQPVFFGDESYNEDLYTQAIKSYVDSLDGIHFLFIIRYGPHSSIVQPPSVRPDGTTANFSACYEYFPSNNRNMRFVQ